MEEDMWPAEIRSLCCLTLAKSGSLPARGQVAQQEGALRNDEHDYAHETEIPELEWGDPEEKRGDQENNDDHETNHDHDCHEQDESPTRGKVAPLDVKERSNNEEKDQEIESPELEGLGEEPENAKWEMVKSRWQKRLEKKVTN